MQLHVLKSVALEVMGEPYPQLFDSSAARRVIVTLSDEHVAAVASATLEVAPAGGPGLDGGDDLEKLAADREKGVFEAETTHSRIDVADFEAEDRFQVVDHWCQLSGDQTNLSES
jgi:hypothetical protein